jgi:hypothetical protein
MHQDGTHYSKRISLGECKKQNERLYYPKEYFLSDHLPLHLHILQQHYDTLESGYSGQAKTFEIVAREFS